MCCGLMRRSKPHLYSVTPSAAKQCEPKGQPKRFLNPMWVACRRHPAVVLSSPRCESRVRRGILHQLIFDLRPKKLRLLAKSNALHSSRCPHFTFNKLGEENPKLRLLGVLQRSE